VRSHSRDTLLLASSVGAVPIGRISMKVDTEDFTENCGETPKFG
jgi:hypothetical protein